MKRHMLSLSMAPTSVAVVRARRSHDVSPAAAIASRIGPGRYVLTGRWLSEMASSASLKNSWRQNSPPFARRSLGIEGTGSCAAFIALTIPTEMPVNASTIAVPGVAGVGGSAIAIRS